MSRWEPLLPLHLLGVLAAASVTVLAWRRRSTTPQAIPLALGMAACAVWTALASLTSMTSSAPFAVDGTRAVIPLAAVASAAVFLLCLELSYRSWRPGRRTAVLLATEPLVMVLVAIVDRWRPLLLTDVRFGVAPPILSVGLGPAFWLHTAYCYTTMAIGFVLLVRAWHQGERLYRRQAGTVLVAMLVPVAGNVASVYLMSRGTWIGDTPVLFVASALIMSWAVFRQGLLRIVPIARPLVLEQVSDAVLVFAPDGTVVDHNAAMRRLAARLPERPEPPGELVGLDAGRILGTDAALDVPGSGRLRLVTREGVAELDYRVSDLHDRSGRLVGKVAVSRDVTDQVRQAEALEQANEQLRGQLAVIEQLRAELTEQAIRDELTGLHNRRHLIQQWTVELERCRRDGRELTVLLIDADHFKRINDLHGHRVGDQVLVALAGTLTDNLRPGDLLARYGGEELVAVLPGLGPRAAERRAEQMRMLCAGIEVSGPSGPARVTVSIGVASFPSCQDTPEGLLQAADEALYRAKALGRNRVVVAQGYPPGA